MKSEDAMESNWLPFTKVGNPSTLVSKNPRFKIQSLDGFDITTFELKSYVSKIISLIYDLLLLWDSLPIVVKHMPQHWRPKYYVLLVFYMLIVYFKFSMNKQIYALMVPYIYDNISMKM